MVGGGMVEVRREILVAAGRKRKEESGRIVEVWTEIVAKLKEE